MANTTLRLVRDDEEALVFSFLTIAALMEESGEPIQKALGDPDLAKYWQGWGRDGDLAVVAETPPPSGYPVVCAWVRLFSREAPGYGFVSENIPELGIAAVPAVRNQGIGSRALAKLLELCRNRFPGVSLSVRALSPAVRLYERFGFERVAGSEQVGRVGTGSITMLLEFRQ